MSERRPLPFCPLRWLLPALLAVMLTTQPAPAHQLYLFAYAEGNTIAGEAYLRGGAPVKGATVTAFDPSGKQLAVTTTDEKGRFAFALTSGGDHRLVVDAGEGHRAEYTVPAEELPDNLPPRNIQLETDDGSPAEPATNPVGQMGADTTTDDSADVCPPNESLREKIEAVKRQIIALRSDFHHYRNQRQWQDMLGAIGYILGIMGLAFYFLGVRRKERAAK